MAEAIRRQNDRGSVAKEKAAQIRAWGRRVRKETRVKAEAERVLERSHLVRSVSDAVAMYSQERQSNEELVQEWQHVQQRKFRAAQEKQRQQNRASQKRIGRRAANAVNAVNVIAKAGGSARGAGTVEQRGRGAGEKKRRRRKKQQAEKKENPAAVQVISEAQQETEQPQTSTPSISMSEDRSGIDRKAVSPCVCGVTCGGDRDGDYSGDI